MTSSSRGARIERGDLVTVSLAGANRDPAVFDDPDRFDVRRPNAHHHVAFAQGPHVCLGMHLARLEAQIAVRRVLERLPGLALDPPARASCRDWSSQAGNAPRPVDPAGSRAAD